MDTRLLIGPKATNLTGNISKNTLGNLSSTGASSFASLFNNALQSDSKEELQLSNHAQKRLEERSIFMSDSLKSTLSNAIEELSIKGAKDSLVITNEGAFVVNVPNKTLVTAMSINEMQEGIITNIDSVKKKKK